jgi:hypothetical protein
MDRRHTTGPVEVPIIPRIPGADGDDFRRRADELDELRMKAAGRREPYTRLLPHDPGKLDEEARRVFEDTREFVTEAGARIIDVLRNRPDGPKMRELASSNEEYIHEIEKYLASLKPGQAKWQKGASEIIDDILKIGDNAVELYAASQEFSDKFKEYSKDKEVAAMKRDHRMRLINQAIALYYWSKLKDIDKLKITDTDAFKRSKHFLSTLKSKIRDRTNLDRTVYEWKRQAGQARSQLILSLKRRRELDDHARSIGDLDVGIGAALRPMRLWKAGYIEEYANKAEEQVSELENVLAHFQRHLQETRAKIDRYISQAQARGRAHTDSLAREIALRAELGVPGFAGNNALNRFNDSIVRTADATTRTTFAGHAIPTGTFTRYKNAKDSLMRRLATRGALGGELIGSPMDNLIVQRINEAQTAADQARIRADQARIRAEAAERRAEAAKRRADEAEKRARIAKAYDRPDEINPDLSKDVEKHARNIEKMEKEVAEKARLVEVHELNTRNNFMSIAENFQEMRRIRNADALTREDRMKFQKAAEEIEKAEIAKNSVIVFAEQAAGMEQAALANIVHELPRELVAIRQEHASAQRIADLANNPSVPIAFAPVVPSDITVLQNLVNVQEALIPTLQDVIAEERNESAALRDLAQTIKNGGATATPANIATFQFMCRTLADRIETGRHRFGVALHNLYRTEGAAAKALQRNALHEEQDIADDAKSATKHLQKIKDDFADQDDEALKKLPQGHLFIDARAGKFTLGDEAVWLGVREVDGWEPPDPNFPGRTRARFRPDIVKIEVETITREAQGGKLSVETIDTKRLSKRFFKSDNYEYTLEVPGNSFAHGGRRQAVLTITDTKKRDNLIARPAGGLWLPAEYTRTERINMEAAGKITIKENHNNQSNAIETIFSFETQTMPNPVINHAQALERRQGKGWTSEQKRYMWTLDLERRIITHTETGLEFSIDDIDWTETKWDEENGLTLQFKGPPELSQINLLAVGSCGIFSEKLKAATTALKKKKRDHLEQGIEWLKQSTKSYDEQKIDQALASIESLEGMVSYQSSMIKNELQRPPKTREDLKELRKKKKAQKDARNPKGVAAFLEGTADMLMARQSYERKVKERIQTIHKKNPLSADYVWRFRNRPDIYRIEKHTSSKKKQEFLEEIRAANHLDKTVSFQLLEDPKRGRASVVKNAAPNGLELLQEYNRYKDMQDFTNETERQNVENYVKSIENQFMKNQNIDLYYANQWNFERAIEAFTRGQILSEIVDGRTILGASDYIRNLKQVDCPPTSDDSLAGLRQADEYHWVTYLRSGLAEASAESLAEALEKSISAALWMQGSRYGNLKLAEQALNLETTSDEAKRFTDNIDIVATPVPLSETEEKTKVGIDKNKLDPKAIKQKSDKELAQDASEKAEQIYQHAVDSIDRLINSIDDPALQKRYREEAVKMAMDMAKQAFEINKQDKSIQNQWQKLEELVKVMDSQRWKDLWKDLFLLWLKSSVESGSKGVKDFLSEFEKIAMKAIG